MGTRIGAGTAIEASLSGEFIIESAGNCMQLERTIGESASGTWIVGSTLSDWLDADPLFRLRSWAGIRFNIPVITPPCCRAEERTVGRGKAMVDLRVSFGGAGEPDETS